MSAVTDMPRLPNLPVAEVLQPIPPRLFQAWVGGPVPTWVRASFDRWDDFLGESRHDWQVIRITDEDLKPGTPYGRLREVAERYDLPPRGLADLLRVLAVSYLGGFWMDVDVVPLRSLDDLVWDDGTTGITFSQPESRGQKVLWNGGFGFGGAHPFLAQVMDQARRGLARGARNEHFLAGPRAYRAALEAHPDVRCEWTFPFAASAAERRAMLEGTLRVDDAMRAGFLDTRIRHVGPR